MKRVDRNKKIDVMIVDDSAIVRSVLSDVLATDPRINVLAVAQDPIIALNKMEKQMPDVIILDIEMPRMDGLTFLKKVMQEHPIPILICSSLTEAGADTTLKAMQYGAIDIIHKPKVGARQFLEESKVLLTDAVKAAAIARVRPIGGRMEVQPKLSADAVLDRRVSPEMIKTTEKVVVVGASTGGTEALRELLEALPHDSPGMVIVQHMPAGFTAAFAKRLNEGCRVTVKEAANNDTVMPGRVLISPGNFHTLLKRSGARYYVEVKDGPLVCRHRPSVDVLFRSTARYAGQNAVGVIMTGMGDDGAKGLLEMKEAGASTVAQDEKSCIVFGMPKEAIKRNAVDHIVPLDKIASTIMRKCL